MSRDEAQFERMARKMATPMGRRKAFRVFGAALAAATATAVTRRTPAQAVPPLVTDVGPPCEHHMCCKGVKLTSGCDSNCCVERICLLDPYCCTTEWDQLCVSEIPTTCAKSCRSVACP